MARIPMTQESLKTYNLFDKTGISVIFSGIIAQYISATDIVDLGCGHAEIYKDILAKLGTPYLTGYDSDPEALAIARANNPSDRIFFEEHLLPDSHISRTFNGIISMFFLHQLDDATVVWDSVKQLSGTGTQVCIIDMIRVDDPELRQQLVDKYSPENPDVKAGFNAAMQAAYLVEELVPQLYAAGLMNLSIDTVASDDWKILVVHGTM